MDVGMPAEIAGPGVEHLDQADLGAQSIGITAQGQNGIGAGAQQSVQHHPREDLGETTDGRWDGEDGMEEADSGQQFP